jgi:hypothetical protein
MFLGNRVWLASNTGDLTAICERKLSRKCGILNISQPCYEDNFTFLLLLYRKLGNEPPLSQDYNTVSQKQVKRGFKKKSMKPLFGVVQPSLAFADCGFQHLQPKQHTTTSIEIII